MSQKEEVRESVIQSAIASLNDGRAGSGAGIVARISSQSLSTLPCHWRSFEEVIEHVHDKMTVMKDYKDAWPDKFSAAHKRWCARNMDGAEPLRQLAPDLSQGQHVKTEFVPAPPPTPEVRHWQWRFGWQHS